MWLPDTPYMKCLPTFTPETTPKQKTHPKAGVERYAQLSLCQGKPHLKDVLQLSSEVAEVKELAARGHEVCSDEDRTRPCVGHCGR